MESDKPLLELISEKEALLKDKCDLVCIEAEKIILEARKESSLLLEMSEKEGSSAAEELFQKEMVVLQEDIRKIRKNGEHEIEEIKVIGEKKLSRTVEKIMQVIIG
jgi:vacuolar-type H+-ATPase subunit H